MAKNKKPFRRLLAKALVILLALWVLVKIVPALRNALTHILSPLIYLILVAVVVYGAYWFWKKLKE